MMRSAPQHQTGSSFTDNPGADVPALAMRPGNSTAGAGRRTPEATGRALGIAAPKRPTRQMAIVPSVDPDADTAARIAWVRRAIAAGRARLAIQPVSAAHSDNGVAFYEALLRLLDEDGNAVPAAAFIDAVEGQTLIVDLDCAVVRLATVLLRRRLDIRLSINVSPLSLTSSRWRDLLDCCLVVDPAIGKRLIIEITERAKVEDLDAVRAVMTHFRKLGVQFALDDFGAGFTLLTHLRDLPFDIVKLDGSFTRGIEADATQRAYVRALSELAGFFSLPLVAEQVETEAEAQTLQQMGITHMQGYLFGRPSLVSL
jgi:EAL domain-containing protein (putative c-di-GMP-specific phosphodiesterase class I)